MISRSGLTLLPHFLHLVNNTPNSGPLRVACIVPFNFPTIFSLTTSFAKAMFLFLMFLVGQIHSTCDFTGLDIGEGDGVDVVCPAQDYDEPDETFDTIISCECWEHNPFYKESIQNAVRMLKSGGLFFFTCATTGRPVHGVSYLEEQCSKQYDNWKTLPNVERENWDNDYYKNVTEDDVREAIDVDNIFSSYEFEVEENHCDLFFWGIKK